MDLHVAFSRPVDISTIDISVGLQLRKLRERFDLGASTMSRRLSIAEDDLRAFEEGRRRAPASVLIATSISFRVPTAYFYEGLSRVAATQ